MGAIIPIPNPLPTLEQQIVGAKDDGSAEGLLRVRISEGELIKIPFERNGFVSAAAGATVSYTTAAFQNSDGTGTAIWSQISANLIGSAQSAFSTEFFGTQVGIRFECLPLSPQTFVQNQDTRFSVIIDGMPFDFNEFQTTNYINNIQTYNSNTSGYVDRELNWLITDNLPNTRHTIQVINFPDLTYQKGILFFGLLVERRAGYKELSKQDTMYVGPSPATHTLTTSSVVVPDTFFSVYTGFTYSVRGVKSIIYNNTDSASRIVTIQWNKITIETITIAAGATARFDTTLENGINVGDLFSSDGTQALRHFADAASVVNFVCIGGMY